MNLRLPRRSFLKSAAAAGLAGGFGDFGFLSGLPKVTAADANLDSKFVRFRPEIEPLVRLVEDTPRDRLLEEIGARVKKGAPYRDVLSALLLAGVRNIQPRPVGFKFHAVLVVNSAHLASQNSPDSDRWLPIFWALDQFKSSQARDVQEGDWTMSAVAEGDVPNASKARQQFVEAMENWDEAKADAATAGFARTAGAQEVFDVFCRFGARDFRDIGHKAIYVANSWRTLQTVGWQHAEPVLRSLAYALLMHEGSNPAQRTDDKDMHGRRNLVLLKKIRADWQGGARDPNAFKEMMTVLREGSAEQSSALVVELLNRGGAASSLWDALFQSSAEMLMRKPGIVALHAATTANALHYSFQNTANDETRRFLLLQAAAFNPLFRSAAGAKEGTDVLSFEPDALSNPGGDALAEIFADVSGDKLKAARKALTYLNGAGDPQPFLDAAQRLIYLKGTDSHDYKFSSAIIEDCRHLAPEQRNRFLAASAFWLKGSGGADSGLVARTRAALT